MRRIAGQDTQLWAAVTLLCAVSVYVLGSALPDSGAVAGGGFAVRQSVYAIIGLAGALTISRLPIEWLDTHRLAIYAAAVGSIAMVLLVGGVTRGSRRWIEIGPVNVQPSEIGKVLVIIAVSAFLARQARRIDQTRIVLLALAVASLPALLVFAQPDLGTAQVYAVIAFTLIFVAGASWRHVGIIVGVTVLLAVSVLWLLPSIDVHVLKPHQRDRILGFTQPEADPQGVAYHAIQSRIAIGSGGLLGRDGDEPSQVGQRFLPEPHTDFIFATIGERYGFVGGALVLGLFGWLLARCMRAVRVAPTLMTRLLSAGVVAMLSFQILVNVGMTIGLMPITGLPLPFVSYGGSSMIAAMLAVGLVANVLRTSESAPVRYARRVTISRGTRRRRARRPRSAARARV